MPCSCEYVPAWPNRRSNPRRGVMETGRIDGLHYDRTQCCYWVRLRRPDQYVSFAQKWISNGVWLVLGRRPDGATETQSIRFEVGPRFRSISDVHRWLAKHGYIRGTTSNPRVSLEIRLLRDVIRDKYVVEVYDAKRGVIERYDVPSRVADIAADIYDRRAESDGRAILSYEEYVALKRGLRI